jgi:hypothetical protein
MVRRGRVIICKHLLCGGRFFGWIYGRMVETNGGKVETMAVNIKNPQVEMRIRELAALRGVSLVVAVTEAVEREIEMEKRSLRRKKLFADWLMEISRETGPRMNDGKTSKELMDELYDPETGLPV